MLRGGHIDASGVSMQIVHLTPPGRFPTVIHDPGLWWDALKGAAQYRCERVSLNYSWWRVVCGAQVLRALHASLPRLDRWHSRLSLLSKGVDLGGLARGASAALDRLRDGSTYSSREVYLGALAPLAKFLHTLNAVQSELSVSIDAGPRVKNLEYTDSQALTRYARAETFLYRTIELALQDLPRGVDLVTVSITSPEDLLTALIACAILRNRDPATHICLVDHGYENFSLHMYIERLQSTGVFDEFFDSVVVSKDDRDHIVPVVADMLRRKQPIPKYLTRDNVLSGDQVLKEAAAAMPLVSTFAPEPILWTRLSKRRCYWSRCTYCTQNSKYANERAPTRTEILETLDRVESIIQQGCRHFIFSDEALSPSTLRLLAHEIEARNLKFHWACRCKLERAHDAELFKLLGKSGCYEILYGLETTSARILKLMDKYVDGLDEPHLAKVFREMEAAGIAVHVNLIGGYPGDTVAETRRSAEFMAHELAALRGATYVLNSFALLPDTPMARTPERFGLAGVTGEGDLAQELKFELGPEIAQHTADAAAEIPRLREELDEALGWHAIAEEPLRPVAQALYFGSGHGSIFKSSKNNNPFANPLLQAAG